MTEFPQIAPKLVVFCVFSAHLAPMSSSASSVVCASPLPLQFPLPVGSSAASPLTPPLGRIVYTQPATLAGAGGFAVISPSGGGFAALQVIGTGHQLGGAGEAVFVTPPYCMCLCSYFVLDSFDSVRNYFTS
jgi:hypothetical protein